MSQQTLAWQNSAHDEEERRGQEVLARLFEAHCAQTLHMPFACTLIALMMMSKLDCILPWLPVCLQHVLTMLPWLPVCLQHVLTGQKRTLKLYSWTKTSLGGPLASGGIKSKIFVNRSPP